MVSSLAVVSIFAINLFQLQDITSELKHLIRDECRGTYFYFFFSKNNFPGQNEYIRMLISRGANINARQNFGYTALHWAARYGKYKKS